MCFRSPPPPPPLPDPEPVAPKAERTAGQVVTGQQRTAEQKSGRTADSGKRQLKRRGTASLRIPLLTSNQTTRSGNLNTKV